MVSVGVEQCNVKDDMVILFFVLPHIMKLGEAEYLFNENC